MRIGTYFEHRTRDDLGSLRDQARSGRRSDIQGLRAVAVLLVVIFHAGLPVPGGFIGVDMFYVISGFVITGMLLPQLEGTAKIALASFYARRMRRLLPALSFLVAVTAALSIFLLSPLGPQAAAANTGVAASVFAANLYLWRGGSAGYFSLSAEANPLLHTWSLSVEEQFYFAFPVFLLIVWRVSASRGFRLNQRLSAAVYVLVATVASFAFSCFSSLGVPRYFGEQFAFYSPATRAWEFGVGVLIAHLAPALLSIRPLLADALGFGGAALVGLGALIVTAKSPFPGWAALLPVGGTAAMIAAGTVPNRKFNTILAGGPLVWVGDLSYSWYLWHWPVIVISRAFWPTHDWILLAAALGSLAPAWLSYRFVESPIRFNDALSGRRVLPLLAGCILTPIAACLMLRQMTKFESRTEPVRELALAMRQHADHVRGCDGGRLTGGQAGGKCTWNVLKPRGSIFLVGDSNAGQFTEPAAAAANSVGYDFSVATLPSCPFVDLEVIVAPANCRQFVVESIDLLEAQRPALVIIASSSSQVINGNLRLRDPATGETATTASAKAVLWTKGLASVLHSLSRAGIPTLVINAAPHLRGFEPRRCPALVIFTDVDSCAITVDRALIEAQQRPARLAEERAIAMTPLAVAVDFTEDLCSVESCSARRLGIWLHRDHNHLSVDGALTLTGRFTRLIAEHATASIDPP